jgi:hypothetical protein
MLGCPLQGKGDFPISARAEAIVFPILLVDSDK